MKTKEEIFKAFYNFCETLDSMPDEMKIHFRVSTADSYINVEFIKDWEQENGSNITINDYKGIEYNSSNRRVIEK